MLKSWLSALVLLFSATGHAAPGKVLVVLSGVDYVSVKEGGKHPTGYFLCELAIPLGQLLKAGHQVEFATPGGRVPMMDRVSDDVQWFKDKAEYDEAKQLVASLDGMKRPRALELLTESDLSGFRAVFFPGGHAPMEDLYRDASLGRVLEHFHRHNKPTALICHAPISILAARSARGWIYRGYKMTVFSTAEEKQEEDAGHLDGHLTYYVEDALRSAGAKVTVAKPWTSHAIQDRELITGQNPMSDHALAKLLIEALK